MNQQLKSDIDLLFSGAPEESSAARRKLGLMANDRQPDLARLERNIWSAYRTEVMTSPGIFAGIRAFVLRPWVVPIFSLATVLAVIGLFAFNRTMPVHQHIAQFDYTQSSVAAFSFHDKIKLYLRQADGLNITGQGQNYEVATKKIWGQFEFEKKPGNSLAIKTQHGVFSVTGTSFLLFADDKESMLLVEEGTVQVEKDGKKIAVSANQQYQSRRGEFKSLPIPPEERKIFEAFRNPMLKNDAPELLTKKDKPQSPLPAPPRMIFINVTLFDGNTISGQLISETADALVIQPKNFKAITVRKTEVKESERN